MNAKKIMHREDLPDVMSAQHIANYLQISRRVVYDLLDLPEDKGGIRNFRVGVGEKRPSRRVFRADFLKWIDAKAKEQEKKTNRRFEVIEGSVRHG